MVKDPFSFCSDGDRAQGQIPMADIRMAHDALNVLCVLIPLTVGPHLRAWEIP